MDTALVDFFVGDTRRVAKSNTDRAKREWEAGSVQIEAAYGMWMWVWVWVWEWYANGLQESNTNAICIIDCDCSLGAFSIWIVFGFGLVYV